MDKETFSDDTVGGAVVQIADIARSSSGAWCEIFHKKKSAGKILLKIVDTVKRKESVKKTAG